MTATSRQLFEWGPSVYDYETLIQQCDTEIRSGQAHTVSKRLIGINLTRVPRIWRLPLAQICRRVGLWNLGLTLLARLVYPVNSRASADASANELAEYGMLLLRIGATNEAESLLRKVDSEKAPEVLQYRALVSMTRWEFEKAIPYLNLFLSSKPSAYAALVGRVNLALAYVENSQYHQARKILDETIRESLDEGHKRMLCSSLAYRAQLHIQDRNFEAAKLDIETGERYLESAKTGDRLLFLKWKLILDGLESKSLGPLRDLHQRAIDNRSWEDLRLADLYSLRIKFDQGLFLHLIFGTPYAGFRKRILEEMGRSSDRAIYYLGPKNAARMDLHIGRIDHAKKIYRALPAGGKCHQLLEVLLRDFYHPLRIAGIFSELFPGEHFDPGSSPDRVHAIILRTRTWIRENKIPTEIRESNGFYTLAINGEFSFRIPLERQAVDVMSLHFETLQQALHGSPTFTANQARSQLKLARQTVQRIINWGLERGLLERLGVGKNVTYHFTYHFGSGSNKGTPNVA
jgi:hypothetical protein